MVTLFAVATVLMLVPVASAEKLGKFRSSDVRRVGALEVHVDGAVRTAQRHDLPHGAFAEIDAGGHAVASASATKGKKAKSRDVVICRGIGDLSAAQFVELSKVWNRYARQGVITATSALLYRISPNGTFEAFGTPDDKLEEKTKKYLSPEGTKALPHVWCDATCCQNCNLPEALTQAMDRQEAFFQESVAAAKQYGWQGYALDFEGPMPPRERVAEFFGLWREALAMHTGPTGEPLELHLWTGSGVDDASMGAKMTSVVDMGAYSFSRFNSALSSGSSLLTEQHVSSRHEHRAKMLLQADGTSSICPAASLPKGDDLLQRIGHSSKREIVDHDQMRWGLEQEMDTHCKRIGHNACGLGLITYDLANARINCTDMVEIGGKAISSLESIWIWSGGLVAASWEPGLSHYVKGGENNKDNQLQKCGVRSGTSVTSLRTAGCNDCKFDAHFCCDGSSRTA